MAQGTPDPADKRDSRELILEAAGDEFARHGFAGARIDAIARRTKLNVRMIYYHFQSKEGLYQAVLEAIYRHMAIMLDETEKSGEDALGAFSRYIDLLAGHPRFADILVRESIEGSRRLTQLFAEHPDLFTRVHRRAHEMLRASIGAGVFRPLDVPLVIHFVSGLVCLLVAARASQAVFLEGRQVESAEWKMVMMDLLLQGLKAT